MILAIDPGPKESAYVLLQDDLRPQEFAKFPNEDLLKTIRDITLYLTGVHVAIEMIASYGMPVGAEVFETCVWIGRFIAAAQTKEVTLIYRKDEKINLCGSMKAKDANIRQALIDRFGPVGTKKSPGWFYGFKGDVWAAYAAGVTYYDMHLSRGGIAMG